MINLETESQIRAYHEEITRIWNRLERIFAKEIRPILNRAYMNAATQYENNDIFFSVNRIVNQTSPRLEKALSKHYRRVISHVEKRFIPFLESAPKGTIPGVQKANLSDFFWQEMRSFISTTIANKIVKINDTTKKGIREVIRKGIGEGKDNAELAKDIRNMGKSISKYRSKVIARTETHGAYNSATDTAFRKSKLKTERAWSSSIDGRVRLTHLKANNQRRGQKEPFLIGKALLMYPGDPLGPAEEVIHCRCVVLYYTIRI